MTLFAVLWFAAALVWTMYPAPALSAFLLSPLVALPLWWVAKAVQRAKRT